MSDNLYRCTPRKVSAFIEDCCYAGLVPFVQSSPGMGKSSIMRSVASKLNLKLIDHRLSTSAPEDLSGLPRFGEDGRARFSPFADLFPLEGDPLPGGNDAPTHEGWMLFLDEFNSADKRVQAAAYKLILDRMTGQHKLHERCIITAAGNLSTDRAITNPLSTAMQSRVVHIEMEINFDEWLQDVALKEGYDSRVIAYLSMYNSKLMDFNPAHNEKTFCCPRTWEFVNRLCARKPVIQDSDAGLFAGTITSGTAADFVQFTKIFQNLITIADIRRDPGNCPIPSDQGTKYAIISHMMEKVDKDNFSDLATYADRFDLTFRILFYRSLMIRHPEMRQHPAFIRAASAMSRYLNGG